MNGSKNLILGFCAPRRFSHLAPFIASLRHTGYPGDVCLLVQSVAAELVDQLRAHGIIIERATATALPRMTAQASRWFSLLDHLMAHPGEYGQVMLVDPETTVFQADPFAASLPAGIVYTGERRRIGDDEPLRGAMVQAYGEGVVQNVRDCVVANADISIGSTDGILRYLVAMTRELAGRGTPVTGAVDRGVHNYVVHMHPLPHAWLETGETTAASLGAIPAAAVTCGEPGILVDGRLVPVLSQWQANAAVQEHVRTSPRYQADAPMRGTWPVAGRDAVVAFYQRQRDADWLQLFLGSLRCVTDAADLHCVGDFNEAELALLAQYACIVHRVPATEPEIAENIAHFYLSQALDRLSAAPSGQPEQVLVLDNMRAAFPRDPFAANTIGLSVCAEGPTRIADSDYNRERLAFFVPREEAALQRPIVASAMLRGRLPVVRDFYRQMFAELIGRSDLLSIHKVVQGAVNKLCHLRDLGFPVVIRPNGADAYFDIWPSDLALDTRHGLRVGGTVPMVVLGGHPESTLMLKLRIDLNLSDT